MKIFLICLQVISAVGLIIAVLLHSAKGDGIAGIGAQARLFRSSKGMESGLNRLTAGLAVAFLILAGILGVFL
jgi:preprotein translocase subunit SecG